MENALLFIIIPLVVAVVAAGVYYSWKKEKQRQIDLEAVATTLGLSFIAATDSSRDEQFAQFSIFTKGRSRTAWNTMSGTRSFAAHDDLDVVMGDYRYTISSGHGKDRKSKTYRLSYAAVRLPHAATPSVVVRPENFFDKFAGLVGFDDIDFESVEFSKKFHVGSSDKRFAYDLIDPRMMEFLLADAPKLLDIESGWVLVLEGTRRWEPREFEATLQWLGSWFERWPTHVERSLAEGGYVMEGR